MDVGVDGSGEDGQSNCQGRTDNGWYGKHLVLLPFADLPGESRHSG